MLLFQIQNYLKTESQEEFDNEIQVTHVKIENNFNANREQWFG